MAGLFDDVLEDIETDIQLASREVFRCYATKVRQETKLGQGGLPFETGLLRSGLQLTRQIYKQGRSVGTFESTTRSNKGFDYPTHLDLGGIHRGWWRKVNDQKILERCVEEVMPRFKL